MDVALDGDSGLIMRERLLNFVSDNSSWLYTVCLPVAACGPAKLGIQVPNP